MIDTEHKAAYASYEAEQERKAFMSDPDFQGIKKKEDIEDGPDESKLPKAHELARQLHSVESVMKYIHAGRAIFTIRSQTTGTRFTYKVIKPKKEHHKNPRFPYNDNVWFVMVLYGPDNNSMYRYMGCIYRIIEESVAYPGCKITKWEFKTTKGTSLDILSSKSCQAFDWVYKHLVGGKLSPKVEIWHSGCCGACGKLLTVPESIASGIGPVCASK